MHSIANENTIKNVGLFLAHVVFSWLVLPVAAAFLTMSEITPRAAHWILTETPFFPLQIFLGLVVGFWLSRRFAHSVMLWTWIVPALALIAAILFLPPSFSGVGLARSARFFGWRCYLKTVASTS
jgi:hypothetical protein